MKKQLIYAICAVLLLAITISGSTYAFFSASAGENSNVDTQSHIYSIIYTGGTQIEGPLTLTENKTGGANTTVHIKVAEGSIEPLAYLYLNIEDMTENLSSSAVKWEVSGVKNNQVVYTDSGTFAGYNDTNNNIIPLVEDYQLTTEQTDFTVYVWIDGNIAGNEILGASFSGYISASTDRITGVLNN